MKDPPSIRLLVPATLAVAGWNDCLPVGGDSGNLLRPWQLVPGMFLDDALLLASVCVSGRAMFAAAARGRRGPAGLASLLICALAGYCALPGIAGPSPLRDLLESCKLALGALLLLVLAGCTAETARNALRWMVIGMATGALANLRETFESNSPRIGSLPLLLGQNGPGTAMGVCVCLAAWIAISGVAFRDALISAGGSLPVLAGAAISYSKIGMSCALLGVVSLVTVISVGRRGKPQLAFSMLAATIVLVAAAGADTPTGSKVMSSLGEFVRLKIASADVSSIEEGDAQSSSLSARLGYSMGTLEIMESHPFGVGYSGFGTSIRETTTYRLGRSPEESDDPDDLTSANPHGTPLYYASAGGFVGLLLCLAAFGALLRCIVTGLGTFGVAGRVIALSSCIAYAVVFISVPTMLYTKLLIGPAGAALAVAARRVGRAPSG
ncbi:MAG: hypothetical protein FJ167_00440 [Gammaproteobacteria bacterium]|nr:hypothetical protein [Gammaproteobacteria bacterium]